MGIDFDKCTVEFTNIRGEKIPDSVYFKLPGISNSRLKLIDPLEGGSPEMYRDGIPHSYNVSLETGSAIHEQVLSSDEYILSDYEGKPSAKLGYFIDWVYKYRRKGLTIYDALQQASAAADYYVGKLTPKRIRTAMEAGLDYYLRLARGEFKDPKKEVRVLPKNQLEACKKAIHSIQNEWKFKQLHRENLFVPKEFLNEYAFFVDLNVTLSNGGKITLPFKGKADSIIIDHETKTIYLNDLKTTSKTCENFMGKLFEGEWYNGSYQKLHYYRQYAAYLMMLEMYCDQVLGLTDYNYMCNVFVVETTGDNRAKTYAVNNSYIQYGIKEFKELICRVAFHELYGYDKQID